MAKRVCSEGSGSHEESNSKQVENEGNEYDIEAEKVGFVCLQVVIELGWDDELNEGESNITIAPSTS